MRNSVTTKFVCFLLLPFWGEQGYRSAECFCGDCGTRFGRPRVSAGGERGCRGQRKARPAGFVQGAWLGRAACSVQRYRVREEKRREN